MKPEQPALSVSDIAKMMAVSESTVRQWIAQKRFPALRLDGSKKQPIYRVLRKDWERYLESRVIA